MVRPRPPSLLAPWVAACLLWAAACGPVEDPVHDDDAGDDDAGDDDDAVEYEPVWTSLFPLMNFRCTCHRANEGGEGGFVGMEDEDRAYEALVGRPSNDVPSLSRIDPGFPESSYAWLKINGLHRGAGGEGDRMPPTGNALPDRHKEVIRAWIEAGAPRE